MTAGNTLLFALILTVSSAAVAGDAPPDFAAGTAPEMRSTMYAQSHNLQQDQSSLAARSKPVTKGAALRRPQLKILAIGATGSIGRPVVDVALEQGHSVRALVRDSRNARLPQSVELVTGDLTKTETLVAAVAGVDAIVFTHGANGGGKAAEAVDYGGVRNVLVALDGRKVRIALMTAIGVTDHVTEAHDWKRRGERLVRASGCSYTIVRPGWFDYNGADQHRLVLLQGDRRQSGTPRDGVIARRQIAEVLVGSLMSEAADGKTFELVAESGAQQDDLESLFSAVKPDTKDTNDGVEDQQNMPLDKEPKRVLDDLQAVGALDTKAL